MSDVWGALAQSAPSAGVLTPAYTCPAAKHGTIEVVICNRAADAFVRLSQAINGAADALAQYLLYDYLVLASRTKVTARFTVKAGDVVRVYSSSGNVTFNVNGIEEAD